MKKILTLLSFLFFCLVACNNPGKQALKSENDLDAVRNFIQAALYGKYDEARNYMLPDSINEERMRLIERVKLSPDEKRGLATASINIHNVNPVNDSTTIVIYSNSFKNDRDTLKVVRVKGQWLVDFNYLFEHDNDTLMKKPVNKTDSIK
ncbi:MAG: DUF4878 domain-containing protein [Bacteroidota bacterium]|nr:DUF4878 domain-containing protein [Bacteroidota bacterium]